MVQLFNFGTDNDDQHDNDDRQRPTRRGDQQPIDTTTATDNDRRDDGDATTTDATTATDNDRRRPTVTDRRTATDNDRRDDGDRQRPTRRRRPTTTDATMATDNNCRDDGDATTTDNDRRRPTATDRTTATDNDGQRQTLVSLTLFFIFHFSALFLIILVAGKCFKA